MISTRGLSQTSLFKLRTEALPLQIRVRLSYKRAQAIGQAFELTAEDVLHLSPKFWQLHRDQIVLPIDGAVAVLLTIQYNLCAGTLAMYAATQPSVIPILRKVLAFDISGQFMLTEVGHGLNARNLETTATALSDGTFELHTPSERAAKYMPPTAPAGMACVAVVFARLIDVSGSDRGIKPFVVHLHDGEAMSPGVTCRLLPPRGGSRPVNHSLTYFNRVRLPQTSLLGDGERPADEHAAFFHTIHRVVVGGLTMAAVTLPSLRASSFIAARYSMRRTTLDATGILKPIISFQTQKIPVLTALAQSFVMQAFLDKSVTAFCDETMDHRVRHAISSITKTVMLLHTQDANANLADRCGAQGLFEVNQITGSYNDIRGLAIAEGDLLVVAIRLATELMLKRYELPPSKTPLSHLAQHETGLFEELKGQLDNMRHHRSPEFERYNLPHCLGLVYAIGNRMAYDAAVEAKVDPVLVDLYVASCIKSDSAWYVEKLGLTRLEQREMEINAIDAVYPRLDEFLGSMDMESYITAPIISDESWKDYVSGLEKFSTPPHAQVRDNPDAFPAPGVWSMQSWASSKL